MKKLKEQLKMLKGKRTLKHYILPFIAGFIGFQIVFSIIQWNEERKKVYRVICINYGGDTVAIYETKNNMLKIDTLPEDGWKKINYFTTTDGKHVSVATQSGKMIVDPNGKKNESNK